MTDPRDELRNTLAAFDDRRKKIVGGMIAIMIENPDQVRDREWIAEQFTHVTILACDFEDVASTTEGVERVQAYVQQNIQPILTACFQLFGVVGEDLSARASEGLTREEALAHALSYMANPPS